MTKDEALKLALEALEEPKEHLAKHRRLEAITAIQEALANDTSQERVDKTSGNVHEPVGLIESLKDAQPCCGEYQTCWRACTPRGKFLAQRTWVGLTDAEMKQTCYEACSYDPYTIAQAIEAKLKEKNT